MAQAPRLASGSIFARDFKILDLLAEGGMGAVYRAEQQSTRKLRALKLVSTRLASDPKGRERFVREATVGASIDSEHAVEVIGAGIDDESGRPWLAMELLDGADLGAVVRHQGPLSPGQWREVMGQLCHGLAAAHRAGVVHRDLKPANVYVARSRRAGVPFTIKILDFGIAKVVQESGTGATDTDTVGSPLWMAPEQLNAQRPTPATDVWALGLLAFWALTGKHYWLAAHAESSTVQALFVEQLFKPLATPTDRAIELSAAVGLPPGFDQWFLRCTHRDGPQRYPDASTAAQALLALIPADPEAAARLLPEQNLPPSINVDTQSSNTASTLATAPTAWDASAVVSADTVAAARTSFEGDRTHSDPPALGADLSTAPLTGTSTTERRSGTSPFAVMGAVAVVAGLMLGGGYMAWQRYGDRGPSTDVAAMDTAPPADSSPEPEPTPESAGDESSGEPTPTPTDSGDSVEPGPADPMLDLVAPLPVQLDRTVHALRFLGWSESGHRFALRAEHRTNKKGKNHRVTLIQVHDTLTGAMVESFLVSREADDGVSNYQALSKAAKAARPQEDWASRRTALGIGKVGPSRDRPGGGTLHLEWDDAPEGTALAQPLSELGVAYRWISAVDPPEGEPGPKAPKMLVSFEHEGRSWPLLEMLPPFNQRDVAKLRPAGGANPKLEGKVLAFWSPDATRVFLQIEAGTEPSTEGSRTHRRWALRAAGPQIRLIEAGAGEVRARAIAATLADAGLTVAVTQMRAQPVAESQLIAVRKSHETMPTANQIHALLPALPEPKSQRRRREFASVVVMLGLDRHE